jgi:hypothetical protein
MVNRREFVASEGGFMRNIIMNVSALLVLIGSALAQIPSPVPGWPYISDPNNFGVLTTARMADEAFEKHLYFNTISGEMDKFRLDGSFASGWPFYCDTILFGMDPIVLDIDHDGFYEMANEGARRSASPPYYRYSLIYLLDDDATVMPGFPLRVQHPKALCAADLDNDNEYEIIYYSYDEAAISCIDRFGQPKPGWPIGLPDDVNGIAGHGYGGSIGDIDLNGTNEFIVYGDFHIYAYCFDGSMAEGFPIEIWDRSFLYDNWTWPGTMGDIDGDGYPEIMTAGNNWLDSFPPLITSFVVAYDRTGQTKPGWPVYFSGAFVINAPIPSDINGDGQVEIGFQVEDSLYYLSSAGDIIPGWPVAPRRVEGGPRWILSDIITVDIDGDSDCELFSDFNVSYFDSMGHDSLSYYGHSDLFAMDHSGQDLPGYPIRVRAAYLDRPPGFSLDWGDAQLFMAVVTERLDFNGSDSLYVELFQFPDSTGPPDQWPMLSHDNLHTRNYSFQDRVTSAHDEGLEILPKTPILLQNYPNPFNYSTMVQYSLPRTEQMSLTLYDIGGGKVADIYDGVMEAGNHKLRVTMQNVASGVYFIVLRTKETQITRKVLLLK